ncbi:MAG TPA: multidrug ABC transporter [Synechococcales bacterium UBA10510]|nr:multidrug ABC transporter [Synechococcales bacterium UBA10510]
MITTPSTPLLSAFAPFDRLPEAVARSLEQLLEPQRFRPGQTVLAPDVMPKGLYLVRSGSLRGLASDPNTGGLRTIEKLQAGSMAGWVSLVRQQPCEHLRASGEADLLLLPAAAFRDLIDGYPSLAAWFQSSLPVSELYKLLLELCRREPGPRWLPWLERLPQLQEQASVSSLIPGLESGLALAPEREWYVSSGALLASRWDTAKSVKPLEAGAPWLRLVALPATLAEPAAPEPLPGDQAKARIEVGSAAEAVEAQLVGADRFGGDLPPLPQNRGPGKLVLARASGPRDIPAAVVQALASFYGLPLNRDALFDQIDSVLARQASLNLTNLGQILDAIGLRVILSRLPADRLARVSTPAVLMQQGHIGILDAVDPDGHACLLEAELGPLRVPIEQLATLEDGQVELLILERKPDAKEQKFSWSWYFPYLREHKRKLIEVLAVSAVINILMLANPLGIRVLMSQMRGPEAISIVITISILMVSSAVAVSVLKTLRSFQFTDVANRVDSATKATILDHLVRLPQSFFDERPVGRVVFYINQLDQLRQFLVGRSLTLLVDTVFSLFYIIILFMFSPLLTFVVLSFVPLIAGITLFSTPLLKSQIRRTMVENVKYSSYLTESISGIQTIKAQNAEMKTRWTFHDLYSRYLGEDFKMKITRESLSNLGGFIMNIEAVVVLCAGFALVVMGELDFGTVIAFNMLSNYVIRPLTEIPSTWQEFQQCSEQLQIVADVVDRPTEQSELESQNIPMPPLQGHVQFTNLGFSYSQEAPSVLNAVNLSIQKGSFVGVVGGSGSGKSTLLKMVPRFYRPTSGKVLIDGFDIDKIELYSLRRQIGVVPQDSLLFDGTVKDNLMLVKPDATAEELIRAAKIACAHEFIMSMPRGYNSSVGERGSGLSGGQKQRLALARAVLQNPRMLILDEATSALDARTERQVCINLLEAFRGRTVFFITHRLTTVKPADVIVLMDQGAIMEMGPHRDLMEQRGWYYALVQSQAQEGLS